MTTARNTTDVIREGHAAFNDRDRDRLLATIAEDATWHEPGDSPISGLYHGPQEIWQAIFAPMWDAPIRVERHELMGTDAHATARAEFVATLDGAEHRFAMFEVIRVEDGELAERWSFVDEQAGLDQFVEQAQRQLAEARG